MMMSDSKQRARKERKRLLRHESWRLDSVHDHRPFTELVLSRGIIFDLSFLTYDHHYTSNIRDPLS